MGQVGGDPSCSSSAVNRTGLIIAKLDLAIAALLFGAGLGLATGLAAVRYHHRHIPVVSPKPARTTTIVPFTAHGGFGVAVLLER